jgi:hypothetical protein
VCVYVCMYICIPVAWIKNCSWDPAFSLRYYLTIIINILTVFLMFVKALWKARCVYCEFHIHVIYSLRKKTSFPITTLNKFENSSPTVKSLSDVPHTLAHFFLSTYYQPNETKSFLIRRSFLAVQKCHRPQKGKFYYHVQQRQLLAPVLSKPNWTS